MQTTPFQASRYRAVNGNLRKFGATCRLVQWLYRGKVHMKRKLRGRRALKCKPCVGAKGEPSVTGLQTCAFHALPYRAVNGNLRKFGATCRPEQWLHRGKVNMKRKLWGMRSCKCKSCVGAKGVPTGTGLKTTPFQASPNRAVIGNLRKFVATCGPV